MKKLKSYQKFLNESVIEFPVPIKNNVNSFKEYIEILKSSGDELIVTEVDTTVSSWVDSIKTGVIIEFEKIHKFEIRLCLYEDRNIGLVMAFFDNSLDIEKTIFSGNKEKNPDTGEEILKMIKDFLYYLSGLESFEKIIQKNFEEQNQKFFKKLSDVFTPELLKKYGWMFGAMEFDLTTEKYAQTSGMLFLEPGADEDYQETWKTTIDISNIWKQSENKEITPSDFNHKYTSILEQNLSSLEPEARDELRNQITSLKKTNDIEEIHKIYDEIYDIFDKYQIFLKTQSEQK